MRSTWTSSTSPLLHRVNSSSFPQPDLPPVSPPASVNGEETLPQPGCGWEFEIVPEEHMRQKEHEVAARFQRYGRFGMRLEEARLPTPEHYRTAYDELVEAITPSPSPESVADSTRDSRKVIETGRNLKRKGTTNAVHNFYHYRNERRISKQKEDKAMWPGAGSKQIIGKDRVMG